MSAHGALIGLVVVGALAYGAGWATLDARWPLRRGLSGLVGVAITLAALSPPIASYAHTSLRGHMIQHLLLGMYAPLGLVMAAPMTLALRRLPPDAGRVLVRLLATRVFRGLSHPITALVLDIGAMFLLYLTPLYSTMHGRPVLGALLQLHFLLAGCLFVWAIIGPDLSPHRPGPWYRLIVLFVAMSLHGALSKYLYLHGYPLGIEASFAARKSAAEWMYYGGDGAALLMAVLFFAARRNRQRVLGE